MVPKHRSFSLLAIGWLALNIFTQTCTAATLVFPNTPLTTNSEPPPNVLLALSVEWPTAGVAYNGGNRGLSNGGEDHWFDPRVEYLGYFDPNKCYGYSVAVPTVVNEGYFVPQGRVDSKATRGCGGALWSGNYLNWVFTSSVDLLRKNLTGGYRIRDDIAVTILSRAFLDTDGAPGDRRRSTMPIRRVGTGAKIDVSAGRIATDVRQVAPVSAGAMQQTIGSLFYVRGFNGTRTFEVKEYADDGVTQVGLTRYLNARVQVCIPNIPGMTQAESLEPNCKQYGMNFKPEGNVQKYADSMRFGAFGYTRRLSCARCWRPFVMRSSNARQPWSIARLRYFWRTD